MPKLPVVSSDEVIKALSKFGFTVSSQRGGMSNSVRDLTVKALSRWTNFPVAAIL